MNLKSMKKPPVGRLFSSPFLANQYLGSFCYLSRPIPFNAPKGAIEPAKRL